MMTNTTAVLDFVLKLRRHFVTALYCFEVQNLTVLTFWHLRQALIVQKDVFPYSYWLIV